MPGTTPAITILGLGRMGAGIARTYLEHGYEVTVWNRTLAKAEALVELGARRADSVAEAVAASPLVLISLTSYRAGREVLQTPEVERELAGRTVVQLTTGSAKAAREYGDWIVNRDGQYLAGSVMGYPRSLGTDDMSFILGGDGQTFADVESAIRVVAPQTRLVADDPGSVSTVSTAVWFFYYGAYGAFLEMSALAAAAGAEIADFTALAVPMLDVLRDGMTDTARRVGAAEFAGDQATIEGLRLDLEGGVPLFADHGIDAKFIPAFVDYLQKSQDGGDGDSDPAAVFRHVRLAAALDADD